jgi:predicted metal-dependent phosphotriesterase family hydrolase
MPPQELDEPSRYLFLSTTAFPHLREMGITDEQIRTMTVEVPRRFLTGVQQMARGPAFG